MPALSQTPRALALVGMPGAGKSLCADHLRQRGYFCLRFGAVVEDETRRRGLAINPGNERIVREDLRASHGMAAMAVISLPKLKSALRERGHVIIDGLYSFSEYQYLQAHLGAPLIVLAVAAPRQLRYERLATRARRPLSLQQAIERDMLEITNLEKGGPIAIADFTLLNDQSPADLLAGLDRLLGQFAFKP